MHKRIRTGLCVVMAVVLLVGRPGFGWIDTGHKIVALIAWEDMTPKTRAAVTELLKKHARYEKDLLLNLPKDSTPEETARYVFASAATWPDAVRAKTNPMSFTHSHPNWHYIDIPILEDGATVPPASNRRLPGPKDVVEALTFTTGQLKDTTTAVDEKAVAVCWVAHLVGDIHQPLHAASKYDKKQPNGDHGGNYDYVLHDPPYADSKMKLHLLWDSLPGNFISLKMDGYEAAGLRGDPLYSRDAFKSFLEAKDFAAWANESHQLAVDVVYKQETLEEPSAKPPMRDETIPGAKPAYLAQAEAIANQRVALAGYRLADVLNSIFDSK